MTRRSGDGAFLETRVSLLAERLLRRNQRQALVDSSPEEVRPLLELAGLRPLLEAFPQDSRALEQALASILVNETLLLIHGMDSDQRRFIRHWMRRLELINLKLILRSKLSGLSASETLENLLDLGPLTTLPVESLVNTESAEELLRRLESSPYADMARQARKVYEEHLNLFDAEATLDTHYFHQLVHLAQALPGREGDQTRCLLGLWLDQVNLVSLLRFRLTYRLDAPHAYFLLPPGGRHLPQTVLQQLAQQENLEGMLARLPAGLREWLEGAPDIETVESRMIRQVRIAARKLLRRQGRGLARAFAWLYLREQQIQLIHTVLKGQLLGLDRALIRHCANPLANPGNHPAEGVRAP